MRVTIQDHRAGRSVTARQLLCGLLVAAFGLMAAGCGSDDDSGPAAAAPTSGFPLTIKNCGQKLTFDAPPKRVVSMDQVTTETLLGLGLADSIAGTALLFNPPIFPAVAADYAKVPVLADGFPSKEKLLNASPDLVIGNLEFFTYSGFPPGSNFSRKELTAKGINAVTLLCQGEVEAQARYYQSIRQLGQIFGIGERADAFVKSIESGLAATKEKLEGVEPVRTLGVSGVGQGTLVTRGGKGDALVLSGGTNIFADLPPLVAGAPPAVSFEQAVSRDPEAFVIEDPGSTDPKAPSLQETKALLKRRLKSTTAVKNDRFCVVQRIYSYGGPRTVEAVEKLAQCLHPEIGS